MMQQCYYDCKNHAVNLKSIKTMLFKYEMIPKGMGVGRTFTRKGH